LLIIIKNAKQTRSLKFRAYPLETDFFISPVRLFTNLPSFLRLYPNSQIISGTTLCHEDIGRGRPPRGCLSLSGKREKHADNKGYCRQALPGPGQDTGRGPAAGKWGIPPAEGRRCHRAVRKRAGDRLTDDEKHRVLECFLSEILGMERSAASEEACILEHDISDETLDRLEGFMVLPNGHRKRLQGGHRKIQSLVDFPGGTELKVVTIRYQDGCERLSDLGIVPGEIIHLVNVLPQKAVVVKVKGCDIALSPEIASSILVESLQ